MSRRPLITFTSDFGDRDYYVGAVKGVLLSCCPQARIIDISHQVAAHDLLEAAFVLGSAYRSFPPGTVHLVVVDPGVGSQRRGIVARDPSYSFVAPDNGVLSLIFGNRQECRVAAIEAEHYFRQPVSPTFHGRDVFAPVAARLAQGVAIEQMGPEIDDYLLLDLPPTRREGGRLEGFVLHIDTFGNVITSLCPDDIRTQLGEDRPAGRIRAQREANSPPLRLLCPGPKGRILLAGGKQRLFRVGGPGTTGRPAAGGPAGGQGSTHPLSREGSSSDIFSQGPRANLRASQQWGFAGRHSRLRSRQSHLRRSTETPPRGSPRQRPPTELSSPGLSGGAGIGSGPLHCLSRLQRGRVFATAA